MNKDPEKAAGVDNNTEQIQSIPIPKMVPFKNHPFKVVDDDSMLRTMESIAQFGILSPLIVRPLEDGRYQIISGHRRAYAAALVGLTEVPAIVRQMDDNLATILMVDSNLQRENILPSELLNRLCYLPYIWELLYTRHGFLFLEYT